jgi:D-proline reductase (dithiol) PrdB
MFRLSELSSAVRARLGASRSRPAQPWTPLRKPLSECTLAIITSSAYVDVAPQLDAPGVELCDFRAVAGDGPASAPATADQGCRPRRDSADFEADSLGVVIERARELVTCGRVGRLNHRHLILSGAVDSRRRLAERTRVTAARWLTPDQVDVVLLVPM